MINCPACRVKKENALHISKLSTGPASNNTCQNDRTSGILVADKHQTFR